MGGQLGVSICDTFPYMTEGFVIAGQYANRTLGEALMLSVL
jgi:hypothetical protein